MKVQFARERMKVKGYCPICNAWRAFIMHYRISKMYRYFSIGDSTPVEMICTGYDYFGTCSHGHVTVFQIQEKTAMPQYKRDPVWLYTIGRGEKEKSMYLSWLLKHRDWKREEHFNDSSHECNEDCPEFDWSLYDDYE